MGSKRADMENVIKSEMEQRVFTPTEGTPEAHGGHTKGTWKAHEQHTIKRVHVLLEMDDVDGLDRIAKLEGSTQSALIRRAVKELIRRGGR